MVGWTHCFSPAVRQHLHLSQAYITEQNVSPRLANQQKGNKGGPEPPPPTVSVPPMTKDAPLGHLWVLPPLKSTFTFST